jgi:PAS domain S-box-containing protein
VFDTAAEGVTVLDAGGRYVFANKRLAQMLGRTPEDIVGRGVLEIVAEEGHALVRAALARRRAGLAEEFDLPLLHEDGRVVWALLSTSPIFDERGDYLGALGMMTDVTDRRRAEQALRVLAEATAILSESLDYGTTLANVARSLVPRLGEACAIQLLDGDGLRPVALASADPAKGTILERLYGRLRACPDAVEERVLRTGAPETFPRITDDPVAFAVAAGDAEGLELRRALGASTALVLPLRARNETLGVITLASGGRAYDERDRDLIAEIASRAALAVEHARLHMNAEAQGDRLRLIADTSRALGAQLDVQGVARTVARVMEGGVLVALTAADGSVVVRACMSVDEAIEGRLKPLIGRPLGMRPRTIAEEVLRTREPLLLGENAAERMVPPFSTLANELGLGSVIVAPLLVEGRSLGIMAVFRPKEARLLGRDDLGLVSEIADRAAVAFERARLFEAQQRATERLRLLADAGTRLAQSLEVDPTLATLARLTVQWFSHACAVHLIEEGRVTSVAAAASNPALQARLLDAVERYGTEGLPPAVRGVLESRSMLVLPEVTDQALRGLSLGDAQFEVLQRLALKSILIVPLVARGGTVGVLSLARTDGPPYDDDDLATAAELGRRAAVAVDNARLFRRANQAVFARDEFLAIASHELNTPLTPLKMQLDMLRRGRFSPERTAEKLDRASRQVTRLTKLVSDLLDVSRITGGRLHVEPERFDLAVLVDEIVARMSEEADRAGCRISVVAERPCIGSWDRLRIDQVLTNLLTNALKYGGAKPIELELSIRGSQVRLSVRDHGIGIAPEHQRRIFERFERAASTRHYGGFGLGLWIVRQIVQASGGAIAVESTPGEGSVFIVDLPRSE